MRRGFKSWCENTAEQFRTALDQRLDESLDVNAFADHLGIEVWRPEDIPEFSNASLQQLTVHDRDSWSAVTLHVGDVRVVIVNSAHPITRQRNSLVHEFSHLILDHDPGRIDLSAAGHLLLSSFEKDQEDEADWLSGALLVPRAGLQRAYRYSQEPADLAEHFSVSVDLLQWRLRMTGVAIQARRAAQRHR